LYEISSMPMRLSPSSRSPRASTSAQTRVMIAPTVRIESWPSRGEAIQAGRDPHDPIREDGEEPPGDG
jgi:hypothetical protein